MRSHEVPEYIGNIFIYIYYMSIHNGKLSNFDYNYMLTCASVLVTRCMRGYELHNLSKSKIVHVPYNCI